MPPALQGRFLTTGPPGMSSNIHILFLKGVFFSLVFVRKLDFSFLPCSATPVKSCTVRPLHMKEFRSESVFVSPQSWPRYPANTIGYIVLYRNRFMILST